MEKVLVTGGAGYVGSRTVPLLLDRGYSVTILDNLSHEGGWNVFLSNIGENSILTHPNFNKLIKGDIRDEQIVKSALKDQDGIIHLAAIVGAPACEKNPELANNTNVIGTKNIVKNMSLDQKIIYASTGSVYGKVENLCSEDTPTNPLSVYGQNKLEAEKMVLEKGGVALRFATAFGLSNRLRLDLLPNDFSYKLVKERHLDVYESNARRTFIHVYDMARAFEFALKNYAFMEQEVFNIGGEEMNMTKMELAKNIQDKIKKTLGYESRVWEEEGKKDPDQRDYDVSYSKIKKIGEGFKTKIDLDKGIEELVKFMDIFSIKDQYRNV